MERYQEDSQCTRNYPIQEWLLKFIWHVKGKVSMSETFGWWPPNATPIVVACCVFQNIALMFPARLSLAELSEASTDACDAAGEAFEDSHPNAAQKRNYVCNVLS